MSPEAAEYLRRRAEEHAAACADLDDDPLIQALFGKAKPLPPVRTPTQPGAMLRRQAD